MKNKNQIKLFKRRRKFIDKLRGVPKESLPTPDELVKGDKIKILNEIMFFNLDGKLITKLQPGNIVIYLSRKNNPMSNYDNWIYVKTADDTKGILNPIGMINNFKFIDDR